MVGDLAWRFRRPIMHADDETMRLFLKDGILVGTLHISEFTDVEEARDVYRNARIAFGEAFGTPGTDASRFRKWLTNIPFKMIGAKMFEAVSWRSEGTRTVGTIGVFRETSPPFNTFVLDVLEADQGH